MSVSYLTIHVYTTNCFGSSRVLLQSTWDAHPVFMHPILSSSMAGHQEPVTQLRIGVFSFISYLASLSYSESTSCFVFHAQASLPYLLIALFVRSLGFIPKAKIRIVYDIHDLHEKPSITSLSPNILLAWTRYYILSILERFVVSSHHVILLTVSPSLASLILTTYHSREPSVVMSIPPLRIRPLPITPRKIVAQARLVYFGTIHHCPVELFDQIDDMGLELDLYGRDITQASLLKKYNLTLRSSIRLMGGYSPEDLEFLRQYTHLILFSNRPSKNYSCALPNKLFQALSMGLRIIVSPNFTSILDISSTFEHQIYSLSHPNELASLLQNYYENNPLVLIDSRLPYSNLYDISRSQYLSLTIP